MQKHRGYLILSLVYAIVLGGVVLWRQPASTPIAIVEPTPRPTRTPAHIVVYVTGAVVRPDVYILLENSRLKDALQAAGGAREDADLIALNLAAALGDGQQVHVPARGEAPLPAAPASRSTGPISVNTASAADLESLPGIGQVLAQRIVDDRQANGPYTSVEDLARVKGIGPSLIAKIRDLVVLH